MFTERSLAQEVRTLVLLYGAPRLSAVLKAWQYSDAFFSGLALGHLGTWHWALERNTRDRRSGGCGISVDAFLSSHATPSHAMLPSQLAGCPSYAGVSITPSPLSLPLPSPSPSSSCQDALQAMVTFAAARNTWPPVTPYLTLYTLVPSHLVSRTQRQFEI